MLIKVQSEEKISCVEAMKKKRRGIRPACVCVMTITHSNNTAHYSFSFHTPTHTHTPTIQLITAALTHTHARTLVAVYRGAAGSDSGVWTVVTYSLRLHVVVEMWRPGGRHPPQHPTCVCLCVCVHLSRGDSGLHPGLCRSVSVSLRVAASVV